MAVEREYMLFLMQLSRHIRTAIGIAQLLAFKTRRLNLKHTLLPQTYTTSACCERLLPKISTQKPFNTLSNHTSLVIISRLASKRNKRFLSPT